MAFNATEEEKYDQAIGYLRNALFIPCIDDKRATVYNRLAEVYEKQKNWPAALECYKNIISMPQLSKTSTKLALAHINAAHIYEEMEDDHNAIVHYKRGVQLYSQRESPHHPIVSSHKIVIGIKFKKMGDMDAALKTFQEVIELDHSNDVKVAYKQIGMIYSLREDYDMAYYNFIESLKISKREIPPDIDFIIGIHLLLARTEWLRNHFDEGYVHMSEVVVMSENHECTEATQKDIQSTLKIFSDIQCHVWSHKLK
jgi:tetratricopeptide (TPR) repeat protein